MYKVIDLGFEVPETGEPRVRVMQASLVKTASTEIQNFWDTLEQSDDSAYLWVIGVSAQEYYGCNNNGDAFSEEDLKNTHNTFVTNANVFLQHVNKDPAKGIGKPVFSWYNEDMHRVELVLRIDKRNPSAMETVRKIRDGEQLYVSMGTTVAYDVCSICGNKAPTRREYCDHLRYNMKKILPDGRQVYAMNPNPRFFDISIVAKPADPTAFALDKIASASPKQQQMSKTSAELGELAEDTALKLAALNKVSDIIKKVDGAIADAKSTEEPAADPRVDAVAAIARDGFDEFDYPEMPYSLLSDMKVSPLSYLAGMSALDAPITLGDAAWLGGCHALGHCPSHREFSGIFSALPSAIVQLRQRPDLLGGILSRIFGSYGGECDNPYNCSLVLRVIKPVAKARITIISNMAGDGELEKIGAAFGHPERHVRYYGSSPIELIREDFASRGENFAPIEVTDQYGNKAVTSPYHLRQSATVQNAGRVLPFGVLSAALAAGAVGAAAVEPTLLGKVIAATALGVPAYAALRMSMSDADAGKVTTSESVEVPLSTVAGACKFQKRASALNGVRVGTMAGLALPGALALDYAYNKWRYGPYVDVPQEQGGVGNALRTAGRWVSDNPAMSAAGGILVGSQLGKLPRLLFK